MQSLFLYLFFPFFCLDAKEPKNQGCACFATHSLHSAGISETRASRSNSRASGRFIPVARFTLTSRGQSFPPFSLALAFGIEVPFNFPSPRHSERNTVGVESKNLLFINTLCQQEILRLRSFGTALRMTRKGERKDWPNVRGVKQIPSGA